MENQTMDAQTDVSESSYKVITFPASALPEQYRPLLFSKFLRSLRYGNEYFKLIDKDAYFQVYHAYFNTLLWRPGSIVKLAVLSDDPDVVLGWSLTEPNKLHYVYVNKDSRKMGIGKELTKEPFNTITHLTTIGLSIWGNKFNNDPSRVMPTKTLVVFNPFA